MAIYGQPNSWTCGPFALKHGLLALGVFAREDDLARVAASTERHGTDEPGLRRAARAHGVELRLRRATEPHAAGEELRRWLASGVPVLLCLDQWEHWVTAVAVDDDQVVVFDSKYDAPLRIESWQQLMERLACHRRPRWGLRTRTLYDLHPITPRQPPRLRLALTAARARHLLQTENATLARRWDECARRLAPLAVTPGTQAELGQDLERFVQVRRQDIAALVAADAARVAGVVEELAFVAGMYRALLVPEAERDAVARLAAVAGELLGTESGNPPLAASAA